jgi:hypothetical protein
VRIGIYAPYLSTLGGGEKYALVILSEAVEAGFDVDLLSPDEPAPERWLRLNVRVDRSRFSWIPTANDDSATSASRNLDLFLTVHNDVPPMSRAREDGLPQAASTRTTSSSVTRTSSSGTSQHAGG